MSAHLQVSTTDCLKYLICGPRRYTLSILNTETTQSYIIHRSFFLVHPSKAFPLEKKLKLLTNIPTIILHFLTHVPNTNTHLIQHQSILEPAGTGTVALHRAVELFGNFAASRMVDAERIDGREARFLEGLHAHV